MYPLTLKKGLSFIGRRTVGKKKLDRRAFITKASMLLGAAGVSPWIRADMVNKLARKIVPTAGAQALPKTKYFLEFCFRAGYPLLQHGTGREFATLTNANYPNCPWAPNTLVDAGNGLFMRNDSQLIGHAENIALTQGYRGNGLGHKTLFAQREGDVGARMTTPIIEFANRRKGTVLGVPGVNWNRSNMTNNTNGLPDLIDVRSQNDFSNLFRRPSLNLNDNEVIEVQNAISALSDYQKLKLDKRIRNISVANENLNKGLDLLTTDYSSFLDISQMASGFNMGDRTIFGNKRWGDVGQFTALTLKAFEFNLMSSATITIRTGDWHGFRNVGNSTYQAQSAMHLDSILDATIRFLKATPDPGDPSLTLFDTTLIVLNSEFTRGISVVGADNNDNGSNGFMMIGGSVKGGYYGAFDLSNGRGRAYGFDPETGAPRVGQYNPNGEIYNTVNKLLGQQDLKVGGQATVNAIIR